MNAEFFEKEIQDSPMPRPYGIVLCGGDSRRMGHDKSTIAYHGIPQWQYVYNLLVPFCESVFLSLNVEQSESWELPETVEVIVDTESFLNHGPMTGLLSAWSAIGKQPVFLVACDYPLLQMANLLELYKRRTADKQVTCYRNKDWPEPLVAIFEPAAYPAIHDYFAEGNDSLAKFIRKADTAYIDVANPAFLRNVNNPEEVKLIDQECRATFCCFSQKRRRVQGHPQNG